MILFTKTSDQTRQMGTLSLCFYSSYLSPEYLMLPPPASLLFYRLSGLAATERTLTRLRFLLSPPRSPPFPTSPLQLLCDFLRFFTSPPPFLIPCSFPSPFPSLSRFSYPVLLSFPSPFPPPFPSYVGPLVSTSVPVPAPSLLLPPCPSCVRSFVRLHPRSRSCSVPVPIYVPVPALDPGPVSVPALASDPAPGPVCSFPSLGSGYPLVIMRVYEHRAL